VARTYGVLRSDGKSERAIFIVDKDGIIQYIDIHDIDEQPSNDVLFGELERITGLKVPEQPIDRSKVKLPHGGVVMYCTSWCLDCKDARVWLKERGVPVTEVDITSTYGAASQVREWAGGEEITPVFEIDGNIVLDFDRDKLASILKLG